jgi:hypothetical protein
MMKSGFDHNWVWRLVLDVAFLQWEEELSLSRCYFISGYRLAERLEGFVGGIVIAQFPESLRPERRNFKA